MNVRDCKIHEIGDTPFNGTQHGVGILYTTLDQRNDALYQDGKPF